jgi:hypothetical protein
VGISFLSPHTVAKDQERTVLVLDGHGFQLILYRYGAQQRGKCLPPAA